MPAVDIEEFYDQDERRRRSAEIELGTEWTDHRGVRYELNWVADTGEVYVMREPAGPEWEDPFGGIHVDTKDNVPVDGYQVFILGTVGSQVDLERIVSGWEPVMTEADSIHWLAERLRKAGVLPAPAAEAEPD
jgi:hypothetical protein